MVVGTPETVANSQNSKYPTYPLFTTTFQIREAL